MKIQQESTNDELLDQKNLTRLQKAFDDVRVTPSSEYVFRHFLLRDVDFLYLGEENQKTHEKKEKKFVMLALALSLSLSLSPSLTDYLFSLFLILPFQLRKRLKT
jgi:hypothetical protein